MTSLGKKWFVYADGGSKGNGTPNQRAYGSYHITDDISRVFSEIRKFEFGNKTNNAAEWLILLNVLNDAVIGRAADIHLVIYMDSELIVNQFNDAWTAKHPDMKVYRDMAWDYRDELQAMNTIVELHTVPRNQIVEQLGH
jgi:ribonuclease HI